MGNDAIVIGDDWSSMTSCTLAYLAVASAVVGVSTSNAELGQQRAVHHDSHHALKILDIFVLHKPVFLIHQTLALS